MKAGDEIQNKFERLGMSRTGSGIYGWPAITYSKDCPGATGGCVYYSGGNTHTEPLFEVLDFKERYPNANSIYDLLYENMAYVYSSPI